MAWHAGMHGIHVGGLSCHGMPWNTCRGLVMSWHAMEYMSGACHVIGHGIARMDYHVGDCHVMACMEYMSGIVMSPCIYVAMPCPVVQKLSRAAKHFRTLAGLVLLTCLCLPKKPCGHRNDVVLVILLRPRHAIRLNRPNRLLCNLGLMC